MTLPSILGQWGPPPDKPAWAALAAAGVAVALVFARPGGGQTLSTAIGARRVAVFLGFAAAFLSVGYIGFYLRGGPRIIDATSYFLQARAIAEGHFAWHVPQPTASFRGRFLLFHEGGRDAGSGTLAGIFPPGYPLLLSLGFAVGAPLVVGPILALGIAVATFALARELAREAGLGAGDVDAVGILAALFSVVCAALRYHTADTMAHGACALAFALAVLAALRGRRAGLPWFFFLAGLPLGFVVASRFGSALALGAVLTWLALGSARRKTAFVALVVGALPGVVLLALAETAATGHPFGSTQTAYYRASDGPPGCFRYGFGAGIGCLVEHADFVRGRLTKGYGVVAALGVTLRRLRMHTEDIANLEPLGLLVFSPLTSRIARRSLGVRASLALVAALVLAYAPFYFDGDYPGGGARFFADALPIEHALVALGLAVFAWGPAAEASPARTRTRGAVVLALALGGFAVHASYDHETLRLRDGANPMFDPETIANHSLLVATKSGRAPASILFFETDHGFDLALDPDVLDRAALALEKGEPPSGVLEARLKKDDHDRLLFEELGHPSAWVYRFVPETPQTVADFAARRHEPQSAKIDPWTPPPWSDGVDSWRFEAENEWPPIAQEGALWAEPVWVTDTCASPAGEGRALALHGLGGQAGAVTLGLPAPHAGTWQVTPRLLVRGDLASALLSIAVVDQDGSPLATWGPDDARVAASARGAPSPGSAASGPAHPATCIDLPSRTVSVKTNRELRLVLRAVPSAARSVPAGIAWDDATHSNAPSLASPPPIAIAATTKNEGGHGLTGGAELVALDRVMMTAAAPRSR
jgi:hypothetical protein